MSKELARNILRWAIGALFVAAAIIQVTHRELFIALVPPSMHEHASLLQGVMTAVLLGIGLCFLIPRFNPIARWTALLMLVGTLPSAIMQVVEPAQTDRLGLSRPLVIVRVFVQLLMILAVWWTTARRPDAKPT